MTNEIRTDPESQRAPVSERVCEGVCIAFAIFTLCAHAVVASGGTLVHLLVTFGVVSAVLASVLFLRGFPAATQLGSSLPSQERSIPWRVRVLGVVSAVVVACVFERFESGVALFASSIVVLGGAVIALRPAQRAENEAAARGVLLERVLWTLAAGSVWLVLSLHRPNGDDAFYINLAVGAVDAPHAPLLARDTIHGLPGLPILLPVYRLHSIELLNAAVSFLTGLPAIQVFHWICAAVAALLIPLAHASLFRMITPRNWLWSTVAVLLVLGAIGIPNRWYGVFAFARAWQGKAIFLAVAAPLIAAYAIRFATGPTWRAWVLLCAAQISALGLSANALWAAPAVALATLASSLPLQWASWKRFALGALASGYVLAVAALMSSTLEDSGLPNRDVIGGVAVANAFHEVLGTGFVRMLGVASLLGAWALCSDRRGARFAAGMPLIVLVVLLNPVTDAWVRANLVGPYYWRTLWALPLPALMAIVVTAPVQWHGSHTLRALPTAAAAASLLAFVLLAPERFFRASPRPFDIGLKVPRPAYNWAARLNEAVPSGSSVIAPPDVSHWVGTFHDHAFPVETRLQYLQNLGSRMDPKEVSDRNSVSWYAAGVATHRMAASGFRLALDRYSIRGVCLRDSDVIEETRFILQAEGFKLSVPGERYEIWTRLW